MAFVKFDGRRAARARDATGRDTGRDVREHSGRRCLVGIGQRVTTTQAIDAERFETCECERAAGTGERASARSTNARHEGIVRRCASRCGRVGSTAAIHRGRRAEAIARESERVVAEAANEAVGSAERITADCQLRIAGTIRHGDAGRQSRHGVRVFARPAAEDFRRFDVRIVHTDTTRAGKARRADHVGIARRVSGVIESGRVRARASVERKE